MAKGHSKPNQRVLTPMRKSRTAPPIPFPTKNGIELHCPFCDDQHALLPNVESPCGTNVRVEAVQEVYPAALTRREKLTCVKCHKADGEMVRFGNSFVHTENCAPEKKLIQSLPSSSRFAQFVGSLPGLAKNQIQKFTGVAHPVYEIDPSGEKTGKVLAWMFLKESNGKHPATSA